MDKYITFPSYIRKRDRIPLYRTQEICRQNSQLKNISREAGKTLNHRKRVTLNNKLI